VVEEIKRKILITGSTGMLGIALYKELSNHHTIGFSHQDCDITDRERTIDKIININPEIVIHTAAYTDVDGCELNSSLAHNVNAKGTETIAMACKEIEAILIYISTDYVFNGKKEEPYLESDPPDPISVYGKSKLEGEKFVQKILAKYLIIRTSWLFGGGKKSFVENVLQRAKQEKVMPIVNDKYSSPTYTYDLSKAIRILLSTINYQLSTNLYGIYHITNSGSCSWFEYAQRILEYAGIEGVELKPIGLEQLSKLAKRPKMSVLDNRRYNQLTSQPLRHWEEALKEYLRRNRQ
jgi:dTDP-4-dehydrorhamnose reductase